MNIPEHQEFLDQSILHRDQDMLLSGLYGSDDDGFRGCSVGCHLHHIFPEMSPSEIDEMDNKHKAVADHYKYPEWLALLQDKIFEGLPKEVRNHWHVQLAEAVKATSDGYDWQSCLHRVHIGILRISYANAGNSESCVQSVIDLHLQTLNGEGATAGQWSAAESAAESAARSAAESAARSAARSAAESAAWSAAWSAARSAAWSAAWYAAWSAAWSAAYEEMRDAILLAISGETP